MSGEVRSGWRRCTPVAYSQQFSAPQVDINGIEEGKNQLGIVNWQIMGLSTHYRPTLHPGTKWIMSAQSVKIYLHILWDLLI